MIFASFEFLFLFLPAFLVVYFLTPAARRNWVILLFSWAFYAWWRVDFLALLVGVTVFTYVVARMMETVGPRSSSGGRLMVVGLVGNLAALAYFKYANFGVATLNQVIGALGCRPIAWTDIILPVGLSFYVLQSISYLVDVRRGDAPVARSLVDYAAYKAIFCQLIAGPIVRYSEIASQMRGRDHSLEQFGLGGRIFAIGFAMKVAVADTISPLVDAAFALNGPSFVDGWLAVLGYGLQIYFDFSGYSLMAIGLARMIGFHFPENFDNPYLSGSIQEFWRRWHMTLSRFLRDYLYIPLGGNRLGPARAYMNLMLVMGIGGAWHGASWNFIFWGFWHGGLLAAHRWWSHRTSPGRRMPYVFANALTLLAVTVGWGLFRGKNLQEASAIYWGMLGFNGFNLSDDLAWRITPDQLWLMVIAAALIFLQGRPNWFSCCRPAVCCDLAKVLAPFAALALSIVLLYSREATPFLYFQF